MVGSETTGRVEEQDKERLGQPMRVGRNGGRKECMGWTRWIQITEGNTQEGKTLNLDGGELGWGVVNEGRKYNGFGLGMF